MRPPVDLSLITGGAGFREDRLGRRVRLQFDRWRPGDQRVYVSDIRKAAAMLSWRPRTAVADGVERLTAWVEAHADLFRELA